MLKSLTLQILALLFCAQLVATEFNRDGDFQLWFYGALNKKISEKAKVTLEPEVRFGDGGSTLYLFYLQSRFVVSVNEWLELAGGYRQQYARSTSTGQWKTVYNPLADVLLKHTFSTLRFELRNRIQYLILDGGPTIWQYRQCYRFTYPLHLWGITIEPTAHDELFFRQRSGFFENRLAVGAGVPAGEKLKLTLLYVLRDIKLLDEWRRQNVLWICAYTTF